ncbi:MAG TPA: hypothetical protein VNW25_03985 [Candidatus Sulfotelmatobacter sp.]|nr:hypothetical protein [Candidatus Sulfotelmatobacter sp.]
METKLKTSHKAKTRVSVEGRTPELELEHLAEAFTGYLDTLGQFVEALGDIEKKYPGMMEELRSMGKDPMRLKEFAESIPPQTLGIFLRVMIQVMSVSSELNRLSSLPADAKIALGKELKRVALELVNLGKQMGEVTKN